MIRNGVATMISMLSVFVCAVSLTTATLYSDCIGLGTSTPHGCALLTPDADLNCDLNVGEDILM